MTDFERISPQQAEPLLQQQDWQVVDIRDESSYRQSHIPNALHLDNQTVAEFLQQQNPEQAILVYCYHGHSSLNAAAYLSSQGCSNVYSLDGGFEQWRQLFPQHTVSEG